MTFEWTEGETTYRLNESTGVVERRAGNGNWGAVDQIVALTGLRRAAAQLEIYRKALEPLVDAWCRGMPHELHADYLTAEQQRDLRTAASHMGLLPENRLMGLLSAAEDVPPEPTASAEEAFEGKGAKE